MTDWSFIFDNTLSFNERCRRVLKYQLENNPVYRTFYKAISGKYPVNGEPYQIPKLPIRAFKEAVISTCDVDDAELVFKSSGTGKEESSRHYVQSKELYKESILRGFQLFYNRNDYVIWCYTPGYNENPDSSLVYMLNELITDDETGLSKFLPLNQPLKKSDIAQAEASGKNLMIFGAAFGLLDLVEMEPARLPETSVVIETGGMKTRRREMNREELHEKLAAGFGINRSCIHSEYGMCELLSQAYATNGSWFNTPHWMLVTVHDADNPFRICNPGEEGKIGVIDLANLYSCSFILTDDRGVIDEQGRFQVLGRWNNTDMRGCNFLIERD